MEIHIKIIGALLIALALIHFILPRYFNWSTELQSLSLFNRQMMRVHTFFIALVVFLMGLLCLTSSNEIVSTDIGRRVCLGFNVFWGIRLLVQLFGYSSQLWRGKAFETVVHIVFTFFWAYMAVVFGMVFFNS